VIFSDYEQNALLLGVNLVGLGQILHHVHCPVPHVLLRRQAHRRHLYRRHRPYQAHQDRLDHLDHLDNKEHKVTRELQEHRALQVKQEHRDFKVWMAPILVGG
jgi:hypothetical protein